MRSISVLLISFVMFGCVAQSHSTDHFVVAGFSLPQSVMERKEVCEGSGLTWENWEDGTRCSGAPEVFLGSIGETYRLTSNRIEGVSQGFDLNDFHSLRDEITEQYGKPDYVETPNDGCLAQVRTGLDTCLSRDIYKVEWIRNGEHLTIRLGSSGVASVVLTR